MTETVASADTDNTSLAGKDTRRRVWAIVGASSGNLVEWFDFTSIHSVHSTLRISFPVREHHNAASANRRRFAAGFLMRPIGGWLFGRIADRKGRKTSMLISVCMMCVGSLVIACLPGYDTIGTWAPALLLLARLFQGCQWVANTAPARHT